MEAAKDSPFRLPVELEVATCGPKGTSQNVTPAGMKYLVDICSTL